MPGLTRRSFLNTTAAGAATLLLPSRDLLSAPAPRRPKIAVVFTQMFELSHAYHLCEAHMGPYIFNGKLTDPGVDVVSWYVDQFPEGGRDQAREAADRLGMPVYDTIAGALTLGGNDLVVDGVLLIGEHGDYPHNDLGQHMYPRKEFFDQIVAVYRKSGRTAPIFNDKHLSYRWDWSKEMYDTAKDMGFALMAGSSVPLAQRVPEFELEPGAEIEDAVSVHGGPLESYDFHALEVLQSIVEARRGGESGISRLQVLFGDELLKAADQGRWSYDLYEAAMRAEAEHRDDTPENEKALELKPGHGILLEYKDGFRAASIQAGGSSVRWNFACRLKGEKLVRATTFYPGPWGNRNLFRALSHAIQHLFITGKSPYPVERTLLVSGILDAAMHAHHEGDILKETPELEIAYQPMDFSAMREMGGSWKVLTKDTPEPPRFEPGDLDTLPNLQ
ncbi:MAG: hypothetical protein JNG89_10220 [Planctomycetaceae bacterium]|nr:hypothetical protein [Planctomycetaceae bacterium]